MVREQLSTAVKLFRHYALGDTFTDRQVADGYGYLGQLYLVYDFTDASEACFLNAIQLAPSDFRWHHLLGYLYQHAGRLEDAVTHYRIAGQIRPESMATSANLGAIYLQLNDLAAAREQFHRALEFDPGCAAAEAGLGHAALLEGKYDEAIARLKTALRLVSDANRLHYLLAMAYRGAGKMAEAEAHMALQGPVGVRAPDPLVDELQQLRRGERVYLLEGQRAFNAGRFHEAATAYARAAEANPKSVTARINLGSALAKIDATDLAIEEFRAALQIAPENPTAHFNLGMLLKLKGEEDASIEHFRAVLEIRSDDLETHRELARVLMSKDRFEEAVLHLRKAVALDPTDKEMRSTLVGGLLGLARYREAIDVLERVHKVLPGDPLVANQLARLLATCPDVTLRNGERALELALASNRADPVISSGETAALALGELGRCEEAAELHRRLIAAAEEKGDEATAMRLRTTLQTFDGGPPCRPPEASDAS